MIYVAVVFLVVVAVALAHSLGYERGIKFGIKIGHAQGIRDAATRGFENTPQGVVEP